VSLLSARALSVAPPAEGPHGRDAPAEVVRDFSLELDAGEWLAISGPNGCGKTSLLLALAGLWPARSGSVLFAGRPAGPAARQARAQMAVVMQDPSCQLLQPTVREELAFSALNLGLPGDQVTRDLEAWCGRLGLAEELERDPQQLSAGKQQLVLLAAALIARPRLLLADEPAAHLDPGARRTALAALREQVASGLAVLWVTQDAEEAAAADRAIDLAPPGPGEPQGLPAPGFPSASRGAATGRSAPSYGNLLTLRVGAPAAEAGPRVRTPSAFDLRVRGRGVTAIEGPNASGKSVLLAAAAGLVHLDQVQPVWEGNAVPPPILASQYPEAEIFEERVVDEVAYAAVSRGVPRAEAVESARRLLSLLGLADGFMERRTWGLSGGEKRLVSLVGVLIAPSALVVLDEPTAGLDARRRFALVGIVAGCAMKRAVLLASQDGDWIGRLGASRFRVGDLSPSQTPSPSQKTD
jgi:energy-coupling factor transport system ATP-binding protein